MDEKNCSSKNIYEDEVEEEDEAIKFQIDANPFQSELEPSGLGMVKKQNEEMNTSICEPTHNWPNSIQSMGRNGKQELISQEEHEQDFISPSSSSRMTFISHKHLIQKSQDTNLDNHNVLPSLKQNESIGDKLWKTSHLSTLTHKAASNLQKSQLKKELSFHENHSMFDSKSSPTLNSGSKMTPILSTLHSKSIFKKMQSMITKKGKSQSEQTKEEKIDYEQQFWREQSDDIGLGINDLSNHDKKNNSNEQFSFVKQTRYAATKQADSSTRQGSSVSSVSRNNVRKNILHTKGNHLLKGLKIFGSFSFAIIYTITLFVYLELLSQIDIAYTTFQFIPWPVSFRNNFSLTSYYQALIQVTQRNIFSNDDNDEFIKTLKERSNQAVINMKNLLLQYQKADRSKLEFFNNLTLNHINMIITKDLNTFPSSQWLKQEESTKIKFDMSLAYFFQIQISYIYRYTTITENLPEQIIRLDNVNNLIANVTLIDNQISHQCQTILDNLQNQALALMIVDVLFIFLIILLVIPLYIFTQLKNEKILKVFGTLSPHHLEEMIQPITKVLMDASRSQRMKQNGILSQLHFQIRKKNQSQTSDLPTFKMSFLFLSLVFFAGLIIQPITNYASILSLSSEINKNIVLTTIFYYEFYYLIINLFISYFLTNQTNSLMQFERYSQLFQFIVYQKNFFLEIIFNTRPQMVSLTAQIFQLMLSKMDSTYNLYNQMSYVKRVPQLIGENQSQLSEVIAEVSESQQEKNRFQQEEFNNFFYKIYQGNVCEVLRDHQEYISKEEIIPFSDCELIQNGYLKKGLFASLQNFITEFAYLSEMLSLSNPSELQQKVTLWESIVHLRDLDAYYLQLSSAISSLKTFLINNMSDQLLYNQKIQTILFAFQNAMIILIFYFGWIQFYTIISQDMHVTRKLIKNPYILNLLSQ